MEEKDQLTTGQTNPEPDEGFEEYGWDFHKKPLLFAAVLTALLYAFVFFYVNR